MGKQIGWAPIPRWIVEDWVWEDKPFAKGQAFVDMWMLANHKDTKIPYKGEVITCKRGTVNLSISYLANRWGWSRNKTRRFLNELESDGKVNVTATKHRTTITIENYGFCDDLGATKGQPKGNQKSTKGQREGNERATKGQPVDITNNDNNDNNDNKYSDDPMLEAAIQEFIVFRKKIKKPMTDHAVKLMLSKLNKLASSTAEQIEILNQSILNGWQGIFPLKDKTVCIEEEEDSLDDLF